MQNRNYPLLPETSFFAGVTNGRIPGPLMAGHSMYSAPGTIGLHHEANSDSERIKELGQFVAKYKAMVKKGRDRGYHTAADNLEHWLNASGEDRELDWQWLRNREVVKEAERKNQERFEKKITALGGKLKFGEKTFFQDYWDVSIDVWPILDDTKLFYASGRSALTTRGKFLIERHAKDFGHGPVAYINYRGVVQHHWWDRYDWHLGLDVWVPGFGSVKDNEALKLERASMAKKFGMYSFWYQSANGVQYIGQLSKTKWRNPAKGITHFDVGEWLLGNDALYDDLGGLLPGIELPT